MNSMLEDIVQQMKLMVVDGVTGNRREQADMVQRNPAAPDCPQYYSGSSCEQGRRCSLRHNPKARNANKTCNFWKNSICSNPNCEFRHVKESELLCAYNVNCSKKNCQYLHPKKKNPAPPKVKASRGQASGGQASGGQASGGQSSFDHIEHLLDFLALYNLQNYWDNFIRINVDLDLLLNLNEAELVKELPMIPFADRKRIIIAKNKYKEYLDKKNKPNKDQNPAKAVDARQPSTNHPPRPKLNIEANLYIRDLDKEVNENILRRRFSPFGTITSCKVIRFDDGQSKGFGFVNYTTKEEAVRAISAMSGKMLLTRQIFIAFATRKDETAPQRSSSPLFRQSSRSNSENRGDGRNQHTRGGRHQQGKKREQNGDRRAPAQGECAVCLDFRADVVAIPCGHICMCEKCAAVIRTQSNVCPMCRMKIMDVCKTYNA